VVTSGVRSVRQPAPLRLTRRGRIVVLAFFLLLTTVAGAFLATASRASDGAEGPAPTVVVEQYDTLWSIAERVAPDRAPRAVIWEIRRLNGIVDYTVRPGEVLTLPPRSRG
jgi:hypothetical protein